MRCTNAWLMCSQIEKTALSNPGLISESGVFYYDHGYYFLIKTKKNKLGFNFFIVLIRDTLISSSIKSNMKNLDSKGCLICQRGGWVCIYLTYLCPADCHFCAALHKNIDTVQSDYGSSLNTIQSRLNGTDVRGTSFSGGDCFSVYDRLVDWLTRFRNPFPKAYYWAYTSGLLVNKEKLHHLAGIGLNELRFNIAASGYDDPLILNHIESAVSILDHVAVEIPSIPQDFSRLTAVLPVLD